MKTEERINVKADDEKFIEELCRDTWEMLYKYVYFKVQNKEEAEDITQETYIKAITYIKKNNIKVDKIMSFLRFVSLNILRDRWRKGKRQGIVINFDEISPEETAISDPIEHMDQRKVIEDALKLLNEDQRTVVDLRILKGYTVAETAKKMNMVESTVRVLQYRALQKLSKLLKQ